MTTNGCKQTADTVTLASRAAFSPLHEGESHQSSTRSETCAACGNALCAVCFCVDVPLWKRNSDANQSWSMSFKGLKPLSHL